MTENNKEAQALNEVQWVEDETERRSKQGWVAYLLWFLFGTLGAHRFYMGKNGSAVGMIVLNVVGWLTTWLIIGFVLLGIFWIWWLVDAFLISGWLTEDKEKTRLAVERDLNLRKNLHN